MYEEKFKETIKKLNELEKMVNSNKVIHCKDANVENSAELNEIINLSEENNVVTEEKKTKNKNVLILILLIINILLFAVLFYQYFYLNKLKNNQKSINNKIVSYLNGKTILDKEKQLDNLNDTINNFSNNKNSYKETVALLDKNIQDYTSKIDESNSNIQNLEIELKKVSDEHTNLENKYKQVSNHEISNVITYNQYPQYPNGCEGVALYILLKYYGVNVSLNSIMNALPKGELPHLEESTLYGGNPNYEFLGTPDSTTGWGIWDRGIVNTANLFKGGTINGTGMDFNSIIKLVKNNRPVIVWTSINLKKSFVSKKWIYKPTGETISWKAYNHAVVVIGYTENRIIISDPIDGTKKSMNKNAFITMYNYMGRKAVYY